MEDDSNDESATLYRSDINATVYTEEGEMLTEVELADDDDAPPDDDDNESIWSDVDSEVIQNDPNNSVEVDDMSLHVFRAHTDSVYCAAIHPLRKGLVLTGLSTMI